MYREAAALEIDADYARLPESQVRNVRDYIPKAAIDPGRIAGMSEIIADAVANEVHHGTVDRAADQGAGADAVALGHEPVSPSGLQCRKIDFSGVDKNW